MVTEKRWSVFKGVLVRVQGYEKFPQFHKKFEELDEVIVTVLTLTL